MVKNAESVLAAELVKLGFKRKGKRFFYLQIRDIIGLIAFERPTGLLYLQFAVIPLFFPCPGSIHYTFGNRLNAVYPGLPVLEKSADAAGMFQRHVFSVARLSPRRADGRG